LRDSIFTLTCIFNGPQVSPPLTTPLTVAQFSWLVYHFRLLYEVQMDRPVSREFFKSCYEHALSPSALLFYLVFTEASLFSKSRAAPLFPPLRFLMVGPATLSLFQMLIPVLHSLADPLPRRRPSFGCLLLVPPRRLPFKLNRCVSCLGWGLVPVISWPAHQNLFFSRVEIVFFPFDSPA